MEASNLASPLKFVVLFIVFVLLQVLVCNNILMFGMGVPFIFIFFIISLPLDTNLNILMLVSFLMGFFVDLFSDTLGLNSLACLILAVIRKPVFYAYMPREDKLVNIVPSLTSMGWINYLKYILTLTAIFCFLVFVIELFSFMSFGRIIAMIVLSTIYTIILLIATDALLSKGQLL